MVVMWPQKHITIYETLKRIGDAEQRNVDTWSISLTSGAPLASHLLTCRGRHPVKSATPVSEASLVIQERCVS